VGLLIGVGVVVLVFGALVLLRFPDKPGGKISIAGLHVSSAGAGLPVMVLGAGLIVLGGLKQSPETSTGTRESPSPTAGASSVSSAPAGPRPSSSATSSAPDSGGPRTVTGGPRTSRSGPLTLRVERIDQVDRSLEVFLKAINAGSDSITLPVFGYFFLHDTDSGKSYKVDPASGSWPQTVPPGATVSGTVVVTEPLERTAKTLDAGFSQVFGSFQVHTITVRAIALIGR
jgi:hypothetical protein